MVPGGSAAGLTVALPPPRSQSPQGGTSARNNILPGSSGGSSSSNNSSGTLRNIRPPPRPPQPRSTSPASASAVPMVGVSTTQRCMQKTTPLPHAPFPTPSHTLPHPPTKQQQQTVNILDIATPPRLPPKQLSHQRPIPPQLPPFDQILTPTPAKSSKLPAMATPIKGSKPPIPARSTSINQDNAINNELISGGLLSAGSNSSENPLSPRLQEHNSTQHSTTPINNTLPHNSSTPPLMPRHQIITPQTELSAPSSSQTSPAHTTTKPECPVDETDKNPSEEGGALSSDKDQSPVEGGVEKAECAVCFERQVDCVIYTCGHICCCFSCATDICNNQDRLCPICRQYIKDVIRIYRS